jgi:HPt (histidine-containing phosphotransfer) domain-containing protein
MCENQDEKHVADAAFNGLEKAASLRVAESRNSPPVIFDFQGLMARVDQDREIACEIVNVFLQDMPNLLAAVQSACQRKNVDALHRAAHTLKGASGCAGANLVRQSAQGIENAAGAADYDRIVSIVTLLESQIVAYRELYEQTFPEVRCSGPDRSHES